MMAKPTRQECKKLIGRLMGLPFPPTEPAAIGVIIDVLMDSSESLEHATSVVDALAIGTGSDQRFPTGYDIRQVAVNLRSTELRKDPSCLKCDDAGHISLMKGGYAYSGRCDCWKPLPKELTS